VAFVGVALSLARARKRLTGTGTGPDSGGVFESGPPQGKRPAANPGKEVALVVSGKVIGFHLQNAATVHVTRRQFTHRDQFVQPSAHLGIVVVVVGQLARPLAFNLRNIQLVRPIIRLDPGRTGTRRSHGRFAPACNSRMAAR